MNRLLSLSLCAFALWFLCPALAFAGQTPETPSEVVAATPDATVEKLVERLFNGNCLILTANPQLGLITFRYQSEEHSIPARRHVNVLDGSILVRTETATTEQVRVKRTPSWQESYSDHTFQTGVRMDVPAEWYMLVFDMLGLPVPAPGK